MRASQQQLLSIVRTAKNRLEYLTDNDWMLMMDRARRLTFAPGSHLIQERKSVRTLFLLASGKLTITVKGTAVAQISPGEVCGDMAFLENSIASATVTADGDVEAYALEWSALSDLFDLYPHLASRFYRSLAVSLSRRLRQQLVSS